MSNSKIQKVSVICIHIDSFGQLSGWMPEEISEQIHCIHQRLFYFYSISLSLDGIF
jgi:hypothetical protein